MTEFCAYLRELIAQRRRHPGGDEDLLTRLLGDDQLTETELAQNCVFLLNAGHETTTNLVDNGLHLLLTHPDSLQRLRKEPQLFHHHARRYQYESFAPLVCNPLVGIRVIKGNATTNAHGNAHVLNRFLWISASESGLLDVMGSGTD